MAPISSSNPSKRSVYIIGAGRGLGSSLATLFASKGFSNIGLIARSSSTLLETSTLPSLKQSKSIKVATAKADVSSPDSLLAALALLKEQFGGIGPTVVVYNVRSQGKPGDKFGPTPLLDLKYEVLQDHFKVSVGGALVATQWAVRNMVAHEGHKNAIFFTGGGLAITPFPVLAGLASSQAALRNLTACLHEDLKPKGIHAATVTICAHISPNDKQYNPTLIAAEYWKLYEEQDPAKWAGETVY